MNSRRTVTLLILALSFVIGAGGALAHITPPVVLMSDRDAILGMTGGAKKFFVREVKLTSEERASIRKQWEWQPEEEFYRFYLGRDEQGKLVAAVTFLTEFTIHGPVRVAVGFGPDGKVRGARVVELTEETYPWLKPLIDHNFTQDYVGRDSRGSFTLGGRHTGAHENMALFYGQMVANLIQRGAVLFEVTMLKRGGMA